MRGCSRCLEARDCPGPERDQGGRGEGPGRGGSVIAPRSRVRVSPEILGLHLFWFTPEIVKFPRTPSARRALRGRHPPPTERPLPGTPKILNTINGSCGELQAVSGFRLSPNLAKSHKPPVRASERPGAGVIIPAVLQNGLPSAGPISEQQLPYRSPPRVQIRTRFDGLPSGEYATAKRKLPDGSQGRGEPH